MAPTKSVYLKPRRVVADIPYDLRKKNFYGRGEQNNNKNNDLEPSGWQEFLAKQIASGLLKNVEQNTDNFSWIQDGELITVMIPNNGRFDADNFDINNTGISSPIISGNWFAGISELSVFVSDIIEISFVSEDPHWPLLITGGNVDAQTAFNLAQISKQSNATYYYEFWATKAGNAGFAPACRSLGDYFLALNKPVDAYYWYAKAAEKKDQVALAHVAQFLSTPNNSDYDPILAEDILIHLATQGFSHSLYNLGCMHLLPMENFDSDPALGFAYMKECVRLTNDPDAIRMLAQCYLQGLGTEKDTKAGLELLGDAGMNKQEQEREMKKAEEAAKKAEEERLAAERKAEEERIAAEKRAEELRIARQKAEEERLAAERKAEEERIAAAKKAEEERLAAQKAEEERIAAAKKAEEERLAAQKAEEERIAAAKKAEEERIAAEKKAEEARIAAQKAEEERLAAERKAEEERIAAEKNAEEMRAAAKKAEEERLAAQKAEEERIAAAKKADEERLAAERKAEEERLAAEQKKAEEARIAAEQQKAEEAKKAAEQKKAEEEKYAAQAEAEEEPVVRSRNIDLDGADFGNAAEGDDDEITVVPSLKSGKHDKNENKNVTIKSPMPEKKKAISTPRSEKKADVADSDIDARYRAAVNDRSNQNDKLEDEHQRALASSPAKTPYKSPAKTPTTDKNQPVTPVLSKSTPKTPVTPVTPLDESEEGLDPRELLRRRLERERKAKEAERMKRVAAIREKQASLKKATPKKETSILDSPATPATPATPTPHKHHHHHDKATPTPTKSGATPLKSPRTPMTPKERTQEAAMRAAEAIVNAGILIFKHSGKELNLPPTPKRE